MKIYFIAHDNEFLGRSDSTDGFAIKAGKRLSQIIDNDRDLFIVSSPRKDISESAINIINSLKVYNPGLQVFNIDDDRLEFNEEYCIGVRGLRPNKTVPKILESVGVTIFKNASKTTKRANELSEIIEAMLQYEKANKKCTFIISAGCDVYTFMQNNNFIRKLCYFGDEKINCFGTISKSKQKINKGDIKIIEVELPKEIGYDGRIETIAEIKTKEKNQTKEK